MLYKSRLHRFKKLFFSLILILLLSPSIKIYADSMLQNHKKYISALYSKKKYFECISETRRLLIYFPGIQFKKDYEYFIEANYFLGQQYKTVIKNILNKKKDENKNPYTIMLSNSYLKLGLCDKGIELLKQLEYNQLNQEGSEQLFHRRLELLLCNSDYNEIINEINSYKKYYSGATTNEMSSHVENFIKRGRKSEILSATLSALVPGAGQVYSGRMIDGLISLTAVATTAAGAYFYRTRDEKKISYTLTFFCALFYTGNIYGAYNSASRWNSDSENIFKKNFTEKYIPRYNPLDSIDLNNIF